MLVAAAPSSSSSMSTSPPASGPASLPQRRHRKMLRDGSSEVWPQDAEDVFLEGLREYWDSPWANFSRGRSRWRNQYLVDYLKKHDIERSKKQVASHIQVLRNMLKGLPEFCLVAGPDESEDRSPVRGSTARLASPTSPPRRTSVSSSSSSPRSMPPNVKSELSPTLQHHFEHHQQSFPHKLPDMSMDYPMDMLTSNHGPIRVSGLCLWTDGMQPNYIDIDALPANPSTTSLSPGLTLSPQPLIRTSLRVRLTVPPSIDASSSSASSTSSVTSITDPPDIRGFNGAISFSQPLPPNAKCLTKVHVASQCISQENAPLIPATDPSFQPHLFASSSQPSSPSPVEDKYPAFLPDSWLSRCRWLDTGSKKTLVTQQVLVDNEVLFVVIYDLQRVKHVQPSAELILFHKHFDPAPSRSMNQQQHVQQQQQQSMSPQMHIPSPTASHFVNAFTPYDTGSGPQPVQHHPRNQHLHQHHQHVHHQDFLMPVSPTSPISSSPPMTVHGHMNGNGMHHGMSMPLSPTGRSCAAASSSSQAGAPGGGNTDSWAALLTLM